MAMDHRKKMTLDELVDDMFQELNPDHPAREEYDELRVQCSGIIGDENRGREMTLVEYVLFLPSGHQARNELAKLQDQVDAYDGPLDQETLDRMSEKMVTASENMTRQMRRDERVRVASRIEAGMLSSRTDDDAWPNKEVEARVAVEFADALLARIDKTDDMRCALCLRGKDEVRKMIRSEHGGYICGRCVAECVDLIDDKTTPPA